MWVGAGTLALPGDVQSVLTPRYRARRKIHPLRRLWRGLAWSLAAVLLAIVALVAALRVADPPTTAFMVGARLEAWRGDRQMSFDQRWVPGACLPDSIRLAVMAAEDQKFPRHRGFDVDQITSALADARRGERLRGASTLSQQTAKNLFLWPGQSWLRKGLEAALTVLIEALWPKQRILEVYLNAAEFGHGVYGVEAAAQRFFDKPSHLLSAPESALLAAVLPSPRRLDAAAPSAYLRERQRWILGQMPTLRELPGTRAVLHGDRSRDLTRCGG